MQLFDNQTNTNRELPFLLPKNENYNWHFDEINKVFVVKIPNGMLLYGACFFDKNESDTAMNYLLENENLDWKTADWKNIDPKTISWKNINWRLDAIKMFGKMVLQPRFTAWYGDENKSYKYSGLTMQPEAWNEGLLFLKNKIEKVANTEFNSVLLNWYRDGGDHMGWHQDNEPELGKNPIIASVNLGATRRFLIRNKANPSEKIEIPLHHGTFLLMQGEMQHYWQHSIPKAAKVKTSRLNLTFRKIL
jgi:alkylated DNA repair dioxygenase AlkB